MYFPRLVDDGGGKDDECSVREEDTPHEHMINRGLLGQLKIKEDRLITRSSRNMSFALRKSNYHCVKGLGFNDATESGKITQQTNGT